jgi:uncharacterized protein
MRRCVENNQEEDPMSVRRVSVGFVVAILSLIGVLFVTGAVPLAQAAQTTSTVVPGRTITVVGRGEVNVKPEVAHTTVGVEALAPTVDAAMADAQERMDAVLAALEELGIATRDIQTSNFSINFERTGTGMPAPAGTSTGSSQPEGFYRVSNMVQITIRDLEQVASVIDEAVTAGANNVWGISFGLDNTDTLEGQAREDAVKDARARAESLARLNGVTVGEVVSISEVVGTVPGPMFSAAEGRGGGGTPVEPGEVSFTTQIQIVYSIR